MTELIDVSQGNFPIDYAKLKQSGVSGIWIEVSDGDVRNPHFNNAEIHKARIAGLHVGGYHFCEFRANRSARKELDENFVTPMKQAGLGLIGHDLRPILDIEVTHVGPAQTLDMLEDGVVEMRRAFSGRHPLIYTGDFWHGAMGNPSRESVRRTHPQITQCQLVQAFYGKGDGAFHPVTDGSRLYAWPEVTVQQYTGDKVGAPGVTGLVDRDRLLGGLNISAILL